MIQELDIENLVKKFTEIWTYKIGGSPNKKRVYEYTIMCDHWDDKNLDGKSKCIQDEFCEFGHMIPRDLNTLALAI
jgi:hypothetical protein